MWGGPTWTAWLTQCLVLFTFSTTPGVKAEVSPGAKVRGQEDGGEAIRMWWWRPCGASGAAAAGAGLTTRWTRAARPFQGMLSRRGRWTWPRVGRTTRRTTWRITTVSTLPPGSGTVSRLHNKWIQVQKSHTGGCQFNDVGGGGTSSSLSSNWSP